MSKKSKFTKILALSAVSAVLLNGAAVQPVSAASSLTVLYIKHNAYEYNRYGKRANHDYIGKNSSYNCKGTRYINGRKYYRIKDGSHYYYIKANAVHSRTITKTVRLIHTAYVYNSWGKRIYSQGVRRPGNYFLFGTAYLNNHKLYEIGDGMYVKGGNVAHFSHSNNSSNNDNSSVDTQSNSDQNNSEKTNSDKATIPTRTVYVEFNQDDSLYQPLMQAIKEWNATGVIDFKITNNKKADIRISKVYEPNNNLAGAEEDTPDGEAIEYNTYYPVRNSIDSKVIFEHELGHALGLEHNHDKSIMNVDTDENGQVTDYDLGTIQPVDIANVKKLFNEN